MMSAGEHFQNLYVVRREISRTADLAALLLGRLLYEDSPRGVELAERLCRPALEKVTGKNVPEFAAWLSEYLTILSTGRRGATFYPVHRKLASATNDESRRVEPFIEALAQVFTESERDQLVKLLWEEKPPPFEAMLAEVVGWQIEGVREPAHAPASRFRGGDSGAKPGSPEAILVRTREDLIALASATSGVQQFVVHAGRLIAFALSRYLLARASLDLALPIYAAPAADSHEGVRALAHEILAVHRARFAEQLRAQFEELVERRLPTASPRPPAESAARKVVDGLFTRRARVIPEGRYDALLNDHGSLAAIAYHYYWAQDGAGGRFLRQLHTTHLNMAKKAGLANSRSEHSQWHYYWLSRDLIETLLLVTGQRLGVSRVLVQTLFDDWRERYGIAVLIDRSWERQYGENFQRLGNPEALNEANQRRFLEILAERGRLEKNSDDFPWCVLKD